VRKLAVHAAAVSLIAAVAGFAGSQALTQQASPPIARYTIDAGTSSGMMAMGAGGGGGIGAALNMMRGGNQVAHELVLRLGSSRAATGTPKADHFLPSGARLGVSVPLESPRRGSAPGRDEPVPPGQPQLPQGRLLLFWGCGEHAGPGQPVVIDFSRMARGEIPPGLYAQGLNLPDDWSITLGNSTTYGDWPNARDAKPVPADSSLLGAHRIASTYAPEIAFTLADDFMPALQATGRDMASGAVALNWGALPKATGYYAWGIATNPDGGNSRDMVWWASSSTQQFGGPMADWLSPSTVARLVQSGTVMPPSQTTCTIPAEVRAAGGPMMMTQLFAYGPQANFAYPPRPDDTRVAWRPEWIARVRFRANTSIMLGMPGMGYADEGGSSPQAESPPPSGKPKCRGGLRGVAERAAGLCE
jgi:hypothetical protein